MENVETAKSAGEKLFAAFLNVDFWINIGFTLLEIGLVLLIARVLVAMVSKGVNKVFTSRHGNRIQLEQRRIDTMRVLINNVVSYSIYFIALLIALKQVGIDLQPVLVSAGVLGLAVGFGAQSLVKDVITGFFIIFEDQFAVGDVVTINNVTGTVMVIGLRITKLKSWTGEVHIFPNGTIQQVTNFSIQNSLAVIDISVAYEEDIEHVEQILKEVIANMDNEIEDILSTPQVLGLQALGPSEVIIRVTAECKPNTHVPVSRKIRAKVKAEFDRRGIEIPYPKTVMVGNSKKTGANEG
ncbi:mechanosensitive ion channel family protein [Brevibacillus daliensis]|uniref:mechanosensitive ion channel family protein n=1 Tax=Brevibacillus daliensis TaxID=2892995 RepID=UPI001E3B909D|nr:mechanosensitive ion channel family protein [Brevibacillus daliensis]